MNDNQTVIAITSQPGASTHRARVVGTNCIATCTMSEDAAADAVARKHLKSCGKDGADFTLKAFPGRQYYLTIGEENSGEFPLGATVRVELETGSTFTARVLGQAGRCLKTDNKLYPAVSLDAANVRLVAENEDCSAGREGMASPDPTAAAGVPAAATVALPPNTCAKYPYRACGGGCEDKTCCDCSDPCNGEQMCSKPGQEPVKWHQEGWPVPPAAETDGAAGTPAVPEGSGESETPRPPEASESGHCSDVAASSTAMHCSTLGLSTKAEATAMVLRFPALAANLDAAERYLELHLPDGEEAQAAYIRDQVRGERACGLRAAICTAIVRKTRFPERNQYKAFCAWMEQAAGVKERTAIMYQNAGDLILSPAFADLTSEQKQRVIGCTYVKLEIIAAAGQERLAVIAADPAIEDLNVEDLRAWVREKQLTDKERKLLQDAKAKKTEAEQYRKTPAGRVGLAVTEITKLEGFLDAEAITDPLTALRAGFVLHQAALNRIEAKRDVPLLDLAKIVESMETELAFAKQLLGG